LNTTAAIVIIIISDNFISAMSAKGHARVGICVQLPGKFQGVGVSIQQR